MSESSPKIERKPLTEAQNAEMMAAREIRKGQAAFRSLSDKVQEMSMSDSQMLPAFNLLDAYGRSPMISLQAKDAQTNGSRLEAPLSDLMVEIPQASSVYNLFLEQKLKSDNPAIKFLVRQTLNSRMFKGEDKEDIEQRVHEHMMAALARFDPDFGRPFDGFAIGFIQNRLIDDARNVSPVSRGVQARAKVLEGARREFMQNEERFPTEPELAEITGVPLDAIRENMVIIQNSQVLSLDHVISANSNDGTESMIGDTSLSDEAAVISFEAIEKDEMSEVLKTALLKLSERERTIIIDRFQGELSVKEIAENLSISASRVSQLTFTALKQLKEAMNNKGFEASK